MTPDDLFRILNLTTLAAWLPLIILPRRRWANTILPIAVPAALAVVYIIFLALSLPGSDGGFSTLSGVSELFQDPRALLAGWIHYLAFDLFIGAWQVRDAQHHGVPHLLVVPALILTFLAGPAGLLLYLGIRQFVPARSEAR